MLTSVRDDWLAWRACGDAVRGISFEIPNEYGKYLLEILGEIDVLAFDWKAGGGEAYVIEAGTLGSPFFPATCVLSGEKLYERITQKDYYLIFTDLKGFPHKADIEEVTTYQDFIQSDCEFVFLLVDSSYVTIYAKDPSLIEKILSKANASKYENVEMITSVNDCSGNLMAF